MSDEAPKTNGAGSTIELLSEISHRLESIEARMSVVEAAAKPNRLDVTQLVSQGIAGAIALTVVIGAVVGKVPVEIALAFAGGMAFSLPGLVKGALSK